MDSRALNALMQLFAVLLRIKSRIDDKVAVNYVLSYLQKQFSKEVTQQYLDIFDTYYRETASWRAYKKEQIFHELAPIVSPLYSLPFRQRIFFINHLITFQKFIQTLEDKHNTNLLVGYLIQRVGELLKIDPQQFASLTLFINDDFEALSGNEHFLILTGLNLGSRSQLQKHYVPKLKGQVYVFKLDDFLFLIKVTGNTTIYLNNELLLSNNIYLFSNNTTLTSDSDITVHFTDILKTFLKNKNQVNLRFTATNISYAFSNQKQAIHPFSLSCESNEMIGIIGSSGVGKSTLLKLLSGIIPDYEGEIHINGLNLKDLAKNRGKIMGYIPQEEVIFEQLTVYANVFYQARLNMNTTSENIHNFITETLDTVGLYDIKDLKVGTEEKKIISGGQRKRLHIAAELIRNPQILFIDEPTSGLSSSDAEKIVQFIRQLTLNGKIAFINVHQPSNQILHLFDKLIVLDNGGYPVFYGHPKDAYPFLKNYHNIIESPGLEKQYAEADKILEILEEKKVDEFGQPTRNRKTNPREWYEYFIQENPSQRNTETEAESATRLKGSDIPHKFKQFWYYFIRNISIHVSSKSYIITSLLVAPALAIILAFFSKDYTGSNYVFSGNENIPAFIFMSIIVALFIGLMSSAEEIISDGPILRKESYLGHSAVSYLSSKVLYLIFLSAIQTFLYTIISYMILRFQSGLLTFWTTMFLIAFSANMTGLMISTSFNSVISIYIVIPFIIIPQILLSGIVLHFENINPLFSSKKYTPIVSDLVPTRWGYEAIMVHQFKYNAYEKHFFEIDKKISEVNYKLLTTIPLLEQNAEELSGELNANQYNDKFKLIYNELNKIGNHLPELPKDTIITHSTESVVAFKKDIAQRKTQLIRQRNYFTGDKDKILNNLLRNFDQSHDLVKFKDAMINHKIEDLLVNKSLKRPYTIHKSQIIQFTDPIFKDPESTFGRAHFYAPFKQLGKYTIETHIFNELFIIGISLILLIITSILFKHKYNLA